MGKPTPGVAPTREDGTPVNLGITPARMAKYLMALAGGNYPSTAAVYAGVAGHTIRRWRVIAERERADWNLRNPDQPLDDLLPDWLEEHPPYVIDGTQRVSYQPGSPAFVDDPPVPMPRGFWQTIVLDALAERATAEAEVAALARVMAAARQPQHWQAAMTFLERRHRERWSRPTIVEVSGPNGAPVAVREVSADQLLGRLSDLQAKRAEVEARG